MGCVSGQLVKRAAHLRAVMSSVYASLCQVVNRGLLLIHTSHSFLIPACVAIVLRCIFVLPVYPYRALNYLPEGPSDAMRQNKAGTRRCGLSVLGCWSCALRHAIVSTQPLRWLAGSK